MRNWFNVVPMEPGFYWCRHSAFPDKCWLVRVEDGKVVETIDTPPTFLASSFERSIMQFAVMDKP